MHASSKDSGESAQLQLRRAIAIGQTPLSLSCKCQNLVRWSIHLLPFIDIPPYDQIVHQYLTGDYTIDIHVC